MGTILQGMGSLYSDHKDLLQGNFLTQGLIVHLLCLIHFRRILYC